MIFNDNHPQCPQVGHMTNKRMIPDEAEENRDCEGCHGAEAGGVQNLKASHTDSFDVVVDDKHEQYHDK